MEKLLVPDSANPLHLLAHMCTIFAMTDPHPGYHLVHPVYLDVQMMISFLAHLEGGVSDHEEETKTTSTARERAVKGEAGLRARLLPWAGGLHGQAEVSGERRHDNSSELKSERHHTEASLFNLLYEYLTDDGQLVRLTDPATLDSVISGELVEIAGDYLGNPLEEILALVTSFQPYLDEQKESRQEALDKATAAARKAQRSTSAPKRAQSSAPANSDSDQIISALQTLSEQVNGTDSEFGLTIAGQMAQDIKSVPVHDLLVRTSGGLNVVLTVSSEYYSPTTNEYLRAGEFRAVGKVTKVLRANEVINLTRRTVVGAAGSTVARGIIDSIDSADGLDFDVADPIVTAPAIQVLPMAIFI